MKITDERNFEKVAFDGVALGGVFEWNEQIFIKTQLFKGKDYFDSNAINVELGSHFHFESDAMVRTLDAELIIRG